MAPYLCLMTYSAVSFAKLLNGAQLNEFRKVVIPLKNAELSLELDSHTSLERQTMRFNEVKLSKHDWKENIIILLPKYNCDPPESKTWKEAESSFVKYLLSGVNLVKTGKLMLQLKSRENTNLARIIAKQTKSTFLIQVPLKSPCENKSRNLEDDEQDTWLWWHNFRCLNNYRKNLKVVLKLQADDIPTEENIYRWLSEPLEAIIVPTSLFTPDEKKNPQLTPAWRQAMTFFVRAHINIILIPTANDNLITFIDYFNEFQSHFTGRDEFGMSFERKDVVAAPLQTVHSNVSLYLYSEFEEDNTKYLLYLNALVEALADSPPQASTDVLVVTLLGAGRGPLIRSILTAAERTSRRVRIYVIEKNVNAVITLRYLIAKHWSDKDIELYHKDMREFTPPEKADILVSELLGSFGDNELSPECLDCAVNFIKPNGISIPKSSTSYINPVMAPTYRDEIVKYIRHPVNNNMDFESSYIVLMRNAYHISPSQPLFQFHHPSRGLKSDNTRFSVLKFRAEANCVMNGLAGTFEAELYNEHQMSINRMNHTPGLTSWHPIFFPFLEPIDIKKDDEIEIHFWRCVDSYKVWYEWCCVSPRRTHIHNFGGRSSPIYLN